MYPNDPQQQYPPQQPQPQPQPSAQVPMDYLNQIAPQAPRKKPFAMGIKKLIIIGVLAVVLILLISWAASAIGAAQKDPVERLAARMTTTQGLADAAQKNIKSSKLRGVNSELRIYFTNGIRDIGTPLSRAGVDIKNKETTAAKQEIASAAEMTERLEDARLNAIYDRTYSREMAYQLATLLSLMQQVYKSTNSASLKEYLEEAYINLEPTQKAFADFNEANNNN